MLICSNWNNYSINNNKSVKFNKIAISPLDKVQIMESLKQTIHIKVVSPRMRFQHLTKKSQTMNILQGKFTIKIVANLIKDHNN